MTPHRRLTQHRPKAAYELLLALAEPRPVRFDGRVQPGGELGVQETQSRCLPNATAKWWSVQSDFVQGVSSPIDLGLRYNEVSASKVRYQHCCQWPFLGGGCKPRTSIYGNVYITL